MVHSDGGLTGNMLHLIFQQKTGSEGHLSTHSFKKNNLELSLILTIKKGFHRLDGRNTKFGPEGRSFAVVSSQQLNMLK